jgi:SpoVK/Ycf46/Vps4 family AAA+-type ATPase
MARADLLIELIKNGLNSDNINFRRSAEAICAEERAKQHEVLASRIEELLKYSSNNSFNKKENNSNFQYNLPTNGNNLFQEKLPKKRIDDLILPDHIIQTCRELVEEQSRSDLLHSFGVDPRNKILLIGPPGNGKTSLAEAIAEALMLPMFTVKYEAIIGAYLGETAGRLSKLFDYAKTRQCVLFFDEFETLGKERGDQHETGEIKRVVSSLLLQIDALPSYVVVIAATNHEALLDKAAWRRFQIKLELPKPTSSNLEQWFSEFQIRNNFIFGLETRTLAKKLLGMSYAEAEEFALSVYRQYILRMPMSNIKRITVDQLLLFNLQFMNSNLPDEGEHIEWLTDL